MCIYCTRTLVQFALPDSREEDSVSCSSDATSVVPVFVETSTPADTVAPTVPEDAETTTVPITTTGETRQQAALCQIYDIMQTSWEFMWFLPPPPFCFSSSLLYSSYFSSISRRM